LIDIVLQVGVDRGGTQYDTERQYSYVIVNK
jgi:hypothetical protein